MLMFACVYVLHRLIMRHAILSPQWSEPVSIPVCHDVDLPVDASSLPKMSSPMLSVQFARAAANASIDHNQQGEGPNSPNRGR